MRRLPAILFLVILVFNFVGYRMVIAFMEKGSQAAIETKLDCKDYNDEELITIKTTLHLPYYTSSAEYERAYGSVNIKGVVYEYVKRRVLNDTLELLCLPNAVKTGLQTAANDFAKSSVDGQASVPVKKAPTVLKISLPDFFQPIQTISFCAVLVVNKHQLQNESLLLSNFTQRQERPPQTVPVIS